MSERIDKQGTYLDISKGLRCMVFITLEIILDWDSLNQNFKT